MKNSLTKFPKHSRVAQKTQITFKGGEMAPPSFFFKTKKKKLKMELIHSEKSFRPVLSATSAAASTAVAGPSADNIGRRGRCRHAQQTSQFLLFLKKKEIHF